MSPSVTHPEHVEEIPSDPSLTSLYFAGVLVIALAVAALVDTYMIREKVSITPENGKAYVLRLRDPAAVGQSEIKAGSARLVAAITEARGAASALREAIARRTDALRASEGDYQSELAFLQQKSVEIEKLTTELNQEVRQLPTMAGVPIAGESP